MAAQSLRDDFFCDSVTKGRKREKFESRLTARVIDRYAAAKAVVCGM
jgi:hypothetical protein